MEDIKIVYCYDDNKKPIFYNNAIKGQSYYCINCGEELIVKDGNIRVKHLAHKNNTNCSGTGESIIHKHWKENLFIPGMTIIPPDAPECEVLNVINEVCLNDRYKKQWIRKVIADIVLETTRGDVIVELKFTNPKDWLETEEFYNGIEVLGIYEVSVPKIFSYYNFKFEWKSRRSCISEMKENIKKKAEKAEKQKKYRNHVDEFTIFFNDCSKIYTPKDDETICYIPVVIKKKYECLSLSLPLRINMKKLNCSIDDVKKIFNINSGMKSISIDIINGKNISDECAYADVYCLPYICSNNRNEQYYHYDGHDDVIYKEIVSVNDELCGKLNYLYE